MSKWIDATLDIVRTALAADANDEQRHRGLLACHSLLALLPPRPVPVQLAPQQPDVLDALLERLMPLAPGQAPGFSPRIIPGR